MIQSLLHTSKRSISYTTLCRSFGRSQVWVSQRAYSGDHSNEDSSMYNSSTWSLKSFLDASSDHPVQLDEATLDHVFKMSYLDPKLLDRATVRSDLVNILRSLAHVQDVDVEGVEPLVSPIELNEKASVKLHADVPGPVLDTEVLLSQAPGRLGSYFTTPKAKDP